MARARNAQVLQRFNATVGAQRGIAAAEAASRDAQAQADDLAFFYAHNPAARRLRTVIPRPEPERPVLICHRDPDYENNIIADKSLHVISVDLGASFDGLDSLEDEVAQEWVTERAAEVANLAVESKVKAAMCELLDRTGLPYVLAATGESTDANAIPVLVVRDPDCKNEYVSDDVIDVIDIDIAGEAVAAMSESQFEAFADELWHQVAHLDPEHRQRLALLVLLEEMRDLY